MAETYGAKEENNKQIRIQCCSPLVASTGYCQPSYRSLPLTLMIIFTIFLILKAKCQYQERKFIQNADFLHQKGMCREENLVKKFWFPLFLFGISFNLIKYTFTNHNKSCPPCSDVGINILFSKELFFHLYQNEKFFYESDSALHTLKAKCH